MTNRRSFIGRLVALAAAPKVLFKAAAAKSPWTITSGRFYMPTVKRRYYHVVKRGPWPANMGDVLRNIDKP